MKPKMVTCRQWTSGTSLKLVPFQARTRRNLRPCSSNTAWGSNSSNKSMSTTRLTEPVVYLQPPHPRTITRQQRRKKHNRSQPSNEKPAAKMSTTAVEIIDDKSPVCIPFILERYRTYSASNPARPFIIGLNGVQGAGKTTLVQALSAKLRDGEGLETLVCSIDDFYLRHEDQRALAEAHPDNLLVQVRGEPGTHDMNLARDFFTALCEGRPVKVPQYDKSAYAGRGDRVPESQWETVNGPGQPKVQVVIFEGWCVGFRPLDPTEVSRKWNAPSRTLRRHAIEHLNFVNDRLRDYDAITDMFDAFIHIDAQDTEWVYDWRLEQEAMLRRQRGTGMTDEEVVKFVDAYYPAYELFSDKMRNGLFSDKPKCQLRLIVGKDRKVKQTTVI